MSITRRTFLETALVSTASIALGVQTGCTSADSPNVSSASSTTSGADTSTGAATFQNMVGTPSDYTDRDNWMRFPDTLEHEADALWFYPTAYNDVDGTTVSTIGDAGMREQAQMTYKAMGCVFEGVADVYVPYYRQVNGAKFAQMTTDEIASAGWQESRTDLYAALDHYFDDLNDGRPFILGGHSQGSNMLNIILGEYMAAHPEYCKRMVAAYMLGFSLTQVTLDLNPYIAAASGEDDTGVVVSWNTEGPGNADAGTTLVVVEGAMAINPLNWMTDDTYAGVELNHGSWLADSNGAYSLQTGIADAQVDIARGTVVCTTVDDATHAVPSSMAALFGPDSYHGQDYGFYFENIRENAASRIEAWLAANR